LAAEAVAEGFECVVAAGGDGTLNEVLNGIGRVPGGFDSVALGVLPLGTVNVYARELRIPLNLEAAWQVILAGRQRQLDLASVESGSGERPERQWFAQLAGAGLDARAIQLVDWKLKKRLGPLAYVWAGLKALCERKPKIVVTGSTETLTGELVLVGNGSLYGGDFKTFDTAAMDDGLLDVCVFPKVNFAVLARCAGPLLLAGRLPKSQVRRMKAEEFTLSSDFTCAFELDGELAGQLPVKFAVARRRLRAIVP
jgi:YegS/Rv2252/BmrU family lipid kinase